MPIYVRAHTRAGKLVRAYARTNTKLAYNRMVRTNKINEGLNITSPAKLRETLLFHKQGAGIVKTIAAKRKAMRKHRYYKQMYNDTLRF